MEQFTAAVEDVSGDELACQGVAVREEVVSQFDELEVQV